MEVMKMPIVFLDFESTGTDFKNDRIVELCMIKIFDSGERIKKHTLINHTIPIPQAASDVHGIKDEDVKSSPTFKQLSKGIYEFIIDCDIAGYNSNRFDVPLLYCEFHRAGIVWDYSKTCFIDVCSIFKRKEERTLAAAVKFYLQSEHNEAHGAEADVLATIDVLEAQMRQYADLPTDLIGLSRYCNYDKDYCDTSGCFTKDENGEYVLNFGKHKGKKAREVKDYLQWMLGQDFLPDTKQIINSIIIQQ